MHILRVIIKKNMSGLYMFRLFLCLVFVSLVILTLLPDAHLLYQEHFSLEENPDVHPLLVPQWNQHGSTWEVDPDKRNPGLSIEEFYRTRTERRHKALIETRAMYPTQHHEGTLLTDGFHADLPPDSMWKDHTIVRGPEVQVLLQKMKETERQQKEWMDALQKKPDTSIPSE
jgi:hypothetical protein